ncbi:MAG: Crp/Fnr family transcriptional regulator [Hyphomonadaceae bacterium]
MSPTPPNNRLLLALDAPDRDLLVPHLTRVDLPLRTLLEKPNEKISHVYFVERGIVSVLAKSTIHESIEAGLIGWEGVTGIAVIMGNDRSPHECIVQVDGEALRIEVDAFRDAMTQSESLRTLLLRFVHVFNIQVAHTALANARAKIEERLARWLLMVHDRIPGDEACLTHEFVAIMLGVRRAGVTDALHELEGKGLIRSTRGVVRIVDREGLEIFAGGTFGVPEREYRRLIGAGP